MIPRSLIKKYILFAVKRYIRCDNLVDGAGR
jgi:hypothetical protein